MKPINYIVTDKCNIQCDFCAPGCGPWRDQHLTAAIMINVFDKVSQLGPVPLVVFTGGEPFLYLNEVTHVIEHIRHNSKTPIRIVTNAFWAKDSKRAVSILSDLKKAGLSELNYSVDDFHQKFIPLTTIKNAVNAASEVGIPLLLAHKTYPGSISNREYYEAYFKRAIPEAHSMDREEMVAAEIKIITGLTIPVGRGSKLVNRAEWVPDATPDDRWNKPCEEVLKSITISANGCLSPCCGLVDRSLDAFYVADIVENDLFEVLMYANQTTLYNWLALRGPANLMRFIKTKNPRLQFHAHYLQACELCQDLFSDTQKIEAVQSALEDQANQLFLERHIYESLLTLEPEVDTLRDATMGKTQG